MIGIEENRSRQSSLGSQWSYSTIFRRAGISVPQSARVKVDYELINKDKKITEQLKELVDKKE